jgi:AcrR family transcriptional regulator
VVALTQEDELLIGEEVVRKRRASGEVERLIIKSALEVFAEKGYASATTREIASRAGVHEPMVYRRFGSKAKLFEETVLAPFNELISEYLDTVSPAPDPSWSLEELSARLIGPLYDLLRERRDLFLSLLAASQFNEGFSENGPLTLTGLADLVQRLEQQAETEVARRQLRDIDVPALILCMVALVLGVALVGDWLQPDDDEIGRERLVAEMVKLSIYGITRGGEDAGDRAAPEVMDPAAMAALLDRVADAERRAIRAELEVAILKGQPLPSQR